MANRILHVVDMQADFMRAKGKLYVPGAEALIKLTDAFLASLPKGAFDFALFTQDTHFSDEYNRSPEKEHFPLHCEYGTEGWKLAVNPALLKDKIPVFYMTKNTFDMWGKNPVSKAEKIILPGNEKDAYLNLRRMTPDSRAIQMGLRYNAFHDGLAKSNGGSHVTMIGVASDFCVHDAMLGYLKRGSSVTVLQDLVAGIGSAIPGRAASGRIEDVLRLPQFAPYVASGKLRLGSAAETLRCAQYPQMRCA